MFFTNTNFNNEEKNELKKDLNIKIKDLDTEEVELIQSLIKADNILDINFSAYCGNLEFTDVEVEIIRE